MVDDDAEALGLLPRDAGLLDLGQREAAAEADLGVVALGRAADRGAQQLEGADTERKRLLLARDAAAVLAAGLVEPGLDPGLRRGAHSSEGRARRKRGAQGSPASPCGSGSLRERCWP